MLGYAQVTKPKPPKNKCKCGHALVHCHKTLGGESFEWVECFGCGKEEYRCDCKPQKTIGVSYHG